MVLTASFHVAGWSQLRSPSQVVYLKRESEDKSHIKNCVCICIILYFLINLLRYNLHTMKCRIHWFRIFSKICVATWEIILLNFTWLAVLMACTFHVPFLHCLFQDSMLVMDIISQRYFNALVTKSVKNKK